MRILRNSFYTTLVGSLVGATALAATPLRPSQIHKEVIDQSLAVAITPRGQNFFTLHLDQILADNGYALDQGEIENWKYQATQPIQLQSLPVSFGDTQTTLGNLRQIIEDTLRGFTLNDPQPIVNVNGIQYAAQFSHFGLRVDPRATASLTRANSVVVDLEIEIPNMSISAESIIANDPKNPGIAYYTDPAHPEKIKNWGMNNFSASVAPSADSNGKPVNFRFKVPMEVSIDSRIGISVRALNISTNLPLTAIDWTFAHPLVYPQFDIESGGQVVGQISFDDLEKQINATKTKLAQSLAVYLKTYLTENGAQMINQALTENHFTSVVEDVNEMTPLGAPVNTQPTSLLFGMIPEALKLNQGVLTFQSKAYAEDPSVAQAIPLSSPVSGSPEPDLSSYNTGSYDIALSVNEAFLNRLLQLSFERGYYKNMQISGSTISLTGAPYFVLDSSLPGKNYAKLHLAIETAFTAGAGSDLVTKIGSKVMINNPMKLSFDMIIRYKVDTTKGELTMLIDHIDTNSVQLDSSSVKSQIFFGTVLDRTKSALADFNKGYKAKETPLSDPFDLPQALFGIPLKLKDMQSDTSGHFNVFLEFGA